MSLTVDGVWKAGVWGTTVWADGVWREGEKAQAEETRGGAWLPDYKGQPGDRFKDVREQQAQRRNEIEELFAEAAGEKRVPEPAEVKELVRKTVNKAQQAKKPKQRRNLRKQLEQLKQVETKLSEYLELRTQLQRDEQDFMLLVQSIEDQERQELIELFTGIQRMLH